MAKKIWTELALSNLKTIFEYISQDSLKYAGLVTEKIVDAVKILETFPKSGRRVPELDEELIRELIHDDYRIVYQHRGDAIEILTIHHCSKHFDPNGI